MKPTFPNLVAVTAAAAGQTRGRTRLVLKAFFAELAEATWASGRVVVPSLGSFRVRAARARHVAAPPTVPAARVALPAMRVVVCRVAKNWRRRDGL